MYGVRLCVYVCEKHLNINSIKDGVYVFNDNKKYFGELDLL